MNAKRVSVSHGLPPQLLERHGDDRRLHRARRQLLCRAAGHRPQRPQNALTGADIKNLTGKDVRNNSLTGTDVKNKSLTPKDFTGSVRGPQGPPGPLGATGDTYGSGRRS